MVLEPRQTRGEAGGEFEAQEEGQGSSNEKVEHWSTVVPLDERMMGLHYPTLLLVSSPLQQSFFPSKAHVNLRATAEPDARESWLLIFLISAFWLHEDVGLVSCGLFWFAVSWPRYGLFQIVGRASEQQGFSCSSAPLVVLRPLLCIGGSSIMPHKSAAFFLPVCEEETPSAYTHVQWCMVCADVKC